MRKLFILPLAAISLFLGAQSSFAYEVGDTADCVILNQIAPDGSESEHCIRDPKVEGQAKVLEFFSATCSACQANLPIVSALSARLEGKATVRLVGIDRSEALIREYLQRNKDLIRFEVALDTNRDAKRAYDVIATPTLYVLDRDNKVIFKHTGVLSNADVQEIEGLVEAHR